MNIKSQKKIQSPDFLFLVLLFLRLDMKKILQNVKHERQPKMNKFLEYNFFKIKTNY